MNNNTDIKKLIDCKKGSKVRVLKMRTSYDLKQRLISFGIMKEAIIEVLEHAPAKSTIEIKVGKMSIALRGEEASLIEVVEL